MKKYDKKSLEKYGIKSLKTNLTAEQFKEVYGWILEAEIENAVIYTTEEKMIGGLSDVVTSFMCWESGIWKNGTWKGNLWKKGTWENGIWENGIWENGTWNDGEFRGGIWENGTWNGGKFRGGMWENGTYLNSKRKTPYDDMTDEEFEEFDIMEF